MRYKAIYAVIVSCFVVCLCWHQGSPHIDFSESVINLGDIPNNSEISKTVHIYNRGKKNLIIKSARAGCGCTKYLLTAKFIKPGETADLIITQMATVKHFGKQKEFLYISSNDSTLPVAVITVEYNIANSNSFDPKIIDTGRVNRDRLPLSYMCSFYKNKNYTRESKIDIYTDSPYISTTYSTQDNELLRIQLNINSSIPTGELYSKLSVVTNNGIVFSTNIIGSIVGNYYSYPKMIDLGEISDLESDISRSVKIMSRKNYSYKITDVVIQGDIKNIVNISHIKELNNTWVITIITNLKNNSIVLSKAEISGSLLLTCEDEKYKESVCIPLRIKMAAPRFKTEL